MNQKLFEIETSGSGIFLVYFATNNSMPAKELGEAIIGLEECLKETAKISLLYYDGIYIEPIIPGSIKTKIAFIKKHPFQIILEIGVIAALFNDSFQIIDRFGANSLRNPSKEILEQIKDRKVLDLCRSYNFREGLQKVAQPLNEENKKVQILINDKSSQITCKNKYQFYLDKQDEPILQELSNG